MRRWESKCLACIMWTCGMRQRLGCRRRAWHWLELLRIRWPGLLDSSAAASIDKLAAAAARSFVRLHQLGAADDAEAEGVIQDERQPLHAQIKSVISSGKQQGHLIRCLIRWHSAAAGGVVGRCTDSEAPSPDATHCGRIICMSRSATTTNI